MYKCCSSQLDSLDSQLVDSRQGTGGQKRLPRTSKILDAAKWCKFLDVTNVQTLLVELALNLHITGKNILG